MITGFFLHGILNVNELLILVNPPAPVLGVCVLHVLPEPCYPTRATGTSAHQPSQSGLQNAMMRRGITVLRRRTLHGLALPFLRNLW